MLYPDFKHRYAILAADESKVPDEKAASKGITDRLCREDSLKVFFEL